LRNTRVQAEDPYYSHLRMSLLSLVEDSPKRVLEIGCGQGQTLSFLKRERSAEFVAGVELVPEVAAIARQKPELDLILTGDIEQIWPDFPAEPFDLVIASHILEHVKDPWSVARRLGALMTPVGQFIGSLPNVRNARVSLPLVLFGRLEYTNEGILDWTHTKFFTKGTIQDLLNSSGFVVSKIEPEFSPRPAALNAITLGIFKNLLCFTYNFSARPTAQSLGTRLDHQ
jgi:2-polyprenyl-3-methyl-5-hydroxy-6-metoxy-1,4-benzoquinol methylase